jgi:hypothetical protein
MADTMTSHWTENRPGESTMAEKSESLVSKAGDKADKAVGAVGCSMESLADTIRQQGPESGALGTVTSKTADTLDTAGRYLRDEGATGMLEDMTNCMRRNPGAVLLTGLGLGFLLAYATRRR